MSETPVKGHGPEGRGSADPRNREPLLPTHHTYATVTDEITGVFLTKRTPIPWYIAFFIGFGLLQLFTFAVIYLLLKGVGIWGIKIPVAWGWDIVNFVWWIGIGHAGTLISAILLLLRQEWRTSINRFAEAMTLFAVSCAGMFPVLHLGRHLYFYWLMPYPNTMSIWPNFRSPLVWDVFAVTTYATVSAMFWYVGLVPDLATLRDGANNKFLRYIYGMGALGWRGAARHWFRYEKAYLILAGLSTPLVLSVHTIVGLDFAISIIPGWHTTVFPPYFVAGAIYSGFAMVLTLVIPMRAVYKLHDYITDRHLNNMAKVMLATGIMVAYGYVMEIFIAWYSGSPWEIFMVKNRFMGPYMFQYWSLIACNIVIPQLLWFKSVRANVYMLFLLSLVINVGMWLERYIIIVVSLHRDFLPSSWGEYSATFWDWSTYLGTIGFFVTSLVLFVRVLPAISIFEVRTMVKHKKGKGH